MCVNGTTIATYTNQWNNTNQFPPETVHQLFQRCMREMDEYFARLHAKRCEHQAIKARYNLCVAEAVCNVAKMKHFVYKWKRFAIILPICDLKRNVIAMQIVRDMTHAKHQHVEYLKFKAIAREARASELECRRKLEAMGLYDSSDSDDDSDSDSSKDESWQDIVERCMA